MEQPDWDMEQEEDLNTTKKKLHIFDLDEYSITAICEFLKFDDLRRLFKASRNFASAIGNALRSKDADIWLTIDDAFDPNEKDMRLFLEVLASKIRNVRIRVPAERYETIIRVYFAGGNVRKCVFDRGVYSHISNEFVAANIVFFRSLKLLKIYNCEVDTRSLDAILDAITGIETFEIDLRWSRLNDVPLLKLLSTPITDLNLEQLENLDGIEIDDLPINTTVKELHLSVDPQKINLLRHFTAVQRLELHYDEFFSTPIDMVNLKSICLYFNNVPCIGMENFIYTLVRQNRNTLKRFDLFADFEDRVPIEVDRDRVVKYLCKLQNLYELRLPCAFVGYMEHFTTHFKELRYLSLHSGKGNYVRQKDDFELDLIALVVEAKKLSYVYVLEPYEANMDFYSELYDKLVRAREEQGLENHLYIEIYGEFYDVVDNDVEIMTSDCLSMRLEHC